MLNRVQSLFSTVLENFAAPNGKYATEIWTGLRLRTGYRERRERVKNGVNTRDGAGNIRLSTSEGYWWRGTWMTLSLWEDKCRSEARALIDGGQHPNR